MGDSQEHSYHFLMGNQKTTGRQWKCRKQKALPTNTMAAHHTKMKGIPRFPDKSRELLTADLSKEKGCRESFRLGHWRWLGSEKNPDKKNCHTFVGSSSLCPLWFITCVKWIIVNKPKPHTRVSMCENNMGSVFVFLSWVSICSNR